MPPTTLLLPAALLALAPAALADGSTEAPTPLFDDFDDGSNQGGWEYNPGDVIEGSGGNPGGWWHQPSAFTFAPVVVSRSPTTRA